MRYITVCNRWLYRRGVWAPLSGNWQAASIVTPDLQGLLFGGSTFVSFHSWHSFSVNFFHVILGLPGPTFHKPVYHMLFWRFPNALDKFDNTWILMQDPLFFLLSFPGHLDKSVKLEITFLFLNQNICCGYSKNHLNETVLLSTQNIR